MKKRFEWYLGPDQDELRSIWSNGFLTLDANVLLDFYRYHVQTRENLLAAIESFGDRVWISSQASVEFFKNRKEVISSSEKTFRDAQSAVTDLSNKLDGAVSVLGSHRLIPKKVLEKLKNSMSASISDASNDIRIAQNEHPNYFHRDEILERLLVIFDSRVGEAFDMGRREKLLIEAESRRLAKIPPGYMDADKEGDARHGDFLLWMEALDYSRATSSPMILVTSERKEDWWEKRSGKIVGPRIELLEEAMAYSGQRVLLYQTDSFLHEFSSRAGKAVDADAVEDIRSVSDSRIIKDGGAAVRVRQHVDVDGVFENKGRLEIDLLRPIPTFTGSGAFSPALDVVPKMEIELISKPDGAPDVRVRAATGTNFDFNVHMKADQKGELLPVGTYVVRYEADAWEDLVNLLGNVSRPEGEGSTN